MQTRHVLNFVRGHYEWVVADLGRNLNAGSLQTLEAIDHARAARVPIVVAVNKVDKANANQDRVKKELSEHGLMPEEWGGETVTVPISALKKEGISELLEMVLLNADLLDQSFGYKA